MIIIKVMKMMMISDDNDGDEDDYGDDGYDENRYDDYYHNF